MTMNQKKSKTLRKALRAAGIDPRDARPHPQKFNLLRYFNGDRVLLENCGRAIYQRTKRIGITRAAA
jgi:hypothetical protein